jgi:cytochrome oxidase assembly protein ShyY1
MDVLRTLREPRYAALSVLMLLVATICVLAGTWQIARLEQKISANNALRHNAHQSAVPVADVLPLNNARRPADHRIQYRLVTATGTFDASHQALVRHRSVNETTGYLVLTPFRTGTGTLLVVRGFIAEATGGSAPVAPPPPAGDQQIRARIEPGDTSDDRAAALGGSQVETINPRQQAARLGTPVFAGYAELTPNQPGIGSLETIPAPDLSNPAGGAVEPQHIAYVIQWYLFAALALAAPLAMARAESRRDTPERDFDDERAAEPEPSAQQSREQKLADRYGRPVRH